MALATGHPDASTSLPLLMAVLPDDWQPGTHVHIVLDSGHSALVMPPPGSRPGTHLLIPAHIVGAPQPEYGLLQRPYQPMPWDPPHEPPLVLARRQPTIDANVAAQAALAATAAAEVAIAAAARVTGGLPEVANGVGGSAAAPTGEQRPT
jgi:hypothetical protein